MEAARAGSAQLSTVRAGWLIARAAALESRRQRQTGNPRPLLADLVCIPGALGRFARDASPERATGAVRWPARTMRTRLTALWGAAEGGRW
jgi:hypothetical protein